MDSRCAIMGTCKSTPVEIYHAARITQKHRSKPRLPPVLCYIHFISSVTTCWHSSSPAEAGTHTSEPGTLRRPGGGASSCSGSIGSSGLNTTVWCVTPRCRSSRRTTRASAQPLVLEMSAIRNSDASFLFHVPRAEMIGMPRYMQLIIRSTLQETRSIASTT